MSIDPHISARSECRHCGAAVGHLPAAAGYCPRCGASLAPSSRELWQARAVAIRQQSLRWAAAIIRLRPRPHHNIYAGEPNRSKIITGYGNAMFNLGWRYERRHNPPEAIRCYFKSSKLGNADAATRLAPAEEAAKEQPTPADPPVPAFRLWRDWDAARATIQRRADDQERE